MSLCGLGFLVSQPSDERLEAYYRSLYYPKAGTGVAPIENSTIGKAGQHYAFLDQRLGLTGKVVLDYGCGVGTFLEVARDAGALAIGVEFDNIGRAEAASKGFRVEKTIDAYDTESVDVAYMNDVIEHLRDPVAELRKIGERLRPDGRLFVVTMNMRGLTPRIKRDRWDVVTNPTHLWLYDECSLRRTLDAAGFVEHSVERFRVDFDHHGPVRRTAQRLLQMTGLDASLRMLARPAHSPQ